MGLFDRVSWKRIFKRALTTVNENQWVTLPGFGGGKTHVPVPRSVEQYMKLYTNMVWIYASIDAIAQAGACLETAMFLQDAKNQRQPYTNPRLKRLFIRPNRRTSWQSHMALSLMYYCLTGNVFWEKAEDPLGGVRELFNLRPSRVAIKAQKDGKDVQSYEYRVAPREKPVVFAPGQIVHIKHPNPLSDWVGLAPIKVLTDSLIGEQYAIQYNINLLKNDARPQGMLIPSTPMDTAQMERELKKYNKRHQGADKAGKTAVLPFGMKWEQAALSPKDMQCLESRRFHITEVMSVFGTNNAILGLTENMTFDNYRMQIQSFYRQTMRPLMRLFASEITAGILWKPEDWDNDQADLPQLAFDMEEILREDLNAQSKRLCDQIEHAVVSPNEARDLLKRPGPYPGGEGYFMASTFVPVGAGEMGKREDAFLAALEDIQYALGKIISTNNS